MKPLTRRQAWRRVIANLRKPQVLAFGLCRRVRNLWEDSYINWYTMVQMFHDIHTMDTKRKEFSPYFWPLNERGNRMRIKAIEKLLRKK